MKRLHFARRSFFDTAVLRLFCSVPERPPASGNTTVDARNYDDESQVVMINAEAPLGLVVAPQVLLAGVTRLLHLRVVSVVPGPPF